jgi:hypothetical protein
VCVCADGWRDRALLLAEGLRRSHEWKKRATLRVLVAVDRDEDVPDVHAELLDMVARYRLDCVPVAVRHPSSVRWP